MVNNASNDDDGGCQHIPHFSVPGNGPYRLLRQVLGQSPSYKQRNSPEPQLTEEETKVETWAV